MLTQDVGRRRDLEVIDIQGARDQVRRFVYDAFVRLRPEKQRFGRLVAGKCVLDVLLQNHNARLRIVPARLVDRHIKLDIGGAIGPRQPVVLMRRVFQARIGIGCAGFGSAAVHMEQHRFARQIAAIARIASRIALRQPIELANI